MTAVTLFVCVASGDKHCNQGRCAL